MHEDIENGAVRVDDPLQPVLLAADRDDNLAHVPFVVRLGAIAPAASNKMHTKPIDPEPNSFPGHDDAPFRQELFDIRSDQSKPVLCQTA